MKISEISNDDFEAVVSYSRFQEDLGEEMTALHGVEADYKFITEEKLIKLRDSDCELTEEQSLEIIGIIKFLESLKDGKNTFIDLPGPRPILYDDEGYAYRLSKDYEGLEYR